MKIDYAEIKTILARKFIDQRLQWFSIVAKNNMEDGCGEETDRMIQKAKEMGIYVDSNQVQGIRFTFAYCTKNEVLDLIQSLETKDYGFYPAKDLISISVLKKKKEFKAYKAKRLRRSLQCKDQ